MNQRELMHADRANHKYFAKAKTGGKTRYFYTAAEYQAFMNGAKKGINNAVANVKEKSGYNAMLKRNQAANRYKTAAGARSIAGARANTRGVVNSMHNMATYSPQYNQTKHEAFKAKVSEKSYNKAQAAYEKTALGKAEKVANMASRKLSELSKETSKHVSKGMKAADKALGVSALKKMQKERSEADWFNYVAKNPLNTSQESRSKVQKRAQKETQEYNKANAEYRKTAIGKADTAYHKTVQPKLNTAKARLKADGVMAKNTIDKATRPVTSRATKAYNDYQNKQAARKLNQTANNTWKERDKYEKAKRNRKRYN